MKIIVVGAGGFGKEVAFTIDRLSNYEVIGFIDDNEEKRQEWFYGKPLLGNIGALLECKKKVNVVIGIADPIAKKKVYGRLKNNKFIQFPNIVDSTALFGHNIQLGTGNVLMAHTTYTSDIDIGDFNMVNIGSTIGHDTKIGNFNSIYPSVNVSGNVNIGNFNEIGVGTKIIPSISLGKGNVIGAGSVVIHSIENYVKCVGVPAKMIDKTIESWNKNG